MLAGGAQLVHLRTLDIRRIARLEKAKNKDNSSSTLPHSGDPAQIWSATSLRVTL